MAIKALSIPPNILPAMALVAQHHTKLGALREVIQGLAPGARTRRSISKTWAEQVGVSEQDAWQIVAQLLSFHQLRETFGLSASETYESLLQSFQREAPVAWKETNLGLWEQARSAILEVSSSDHPLYVIQKSLRLKYEHPNILRDVSVVVDARPIFDESGKTVVQWALDYVLQVDYRDGGKRKQLYATLDIRDIRKLRTLCERAEEKTVALIASLQPTNLPVIVTGDSDDE